MITWVLRFYPELFKTLLQCLARNLKYIYFFWMKNPQHPQYVLFGSAPSACYLRRTFSKNFSQFFECAHMFLWHHYWLIKKVPSLNLNLLVFLFPFLEGNILCILIYMFPFQTRTTKSLLTPWKLGSTNKPKHGFCLCGDTTNWYLIQWVAQLNRGFNCCSSFALSWADRVTTGTYSFVSTTERTIDQRHSRSLLRRKSSIEIEQR